LDSFGQLVSGQMCFNVIGYRDWLSPVSSICKHSTTFIGKVIGGYMI